MADIPKFDLHSKDIAADKQAKLKELFPEIFMEGDKIDFDKLRLTLGDSVDTNDERFGLHWAGKKECFSIIQEPSIGTLKPAKDESVNWDDTENLFIEGDNLEVLKLLQKSYYGKIKMIYIDPPYNTGKEFIYPDKYQENLDTYLAYTGQVDDEGYKFSSNAETEGRYHSKWLNMMFTRLFLAKNLLKEDGVIFISIDNHEQSNLKKCCDEIFGEENFMGNIARSTGQTTGQDSGGLGSSFDFVLVYGKNSDVDLTGLPLTPHDLKRFENEDENGKYAYDQMRKTGSSDKREDRPNMFYPIINPDGEEVYPIAPAGYEGRWRFGKDTYKRLKEDGYILWKKTKRNGEEIWWAYVKYYLEGRTKRPSPLWNDLDGNKKASRDLRTLFEGKKVFDFPKPVQLIERMINIVPNANGNDIILDFFAGSSPLSEAIFNINSNTGSKRKFINVQLPEPTEEKSVAYKEGYRNIAEIGKERTRRVIRKIESEKQTFEKELQKIESDLTKLQAEKEKTPKLFENGKSKDLTKLESKIAELKTQITNIENTDLGFKVFKLDKSNFKLWGGAVEDDVPKQIEMAINHLEPDSSEFDILFEILLKAGFELTLPIKELTLADKKVYSVEDDALMICLESELNEDVIRAIAAKEPARFVCLDSGFKDNDQLKTNAVQIMKSHNVHDFKTV